MAGRRPSFTEFAGWAHAAANQEHATGQHNPLLSMLAPQAQATPPLPDDQQFMVHQAKYYREQGNQQLKQDRLAAAQESYSTAMHLLRQVPGQADLVAKLLCNRSLVFLKMNEANQAQQDAMEAIELNKQWHKGYWRYAKAVIAKNSLKEGVEVYLMCCQYCAKTMQTDDLVETVKEIIINSVRISSNFLFAHRLASVKDLSLTWSHVLQRLSEGNYWYHMALLLLGEKQHEPIIRTCPAQSIELERLLAVGVPNLRAWGIQLLICLMKMGARPESMSSHPTRPVLHVAMETSLKAENLSLMEYLLKHHFTDAKDSGIRDPTTGNTVLHLAVMGPGPPALLREAVSTLLRNGIDPLTKNKSSKTALECLRNHDPVTRRLLEEEMTRRRQSVPAYRLQKCKQEAEQAKDFKNYPRAIEKYTEALSFVDGKTETRVKAQLYHDRAEVYKIQGDLTQALKDAKECERLDKKWIKVQMLLADIYNKMKQHSKAVSAFSMAFTCTDKLDVHRYILSQLLELANMQKHLFEEVKNAIKSIGASGAARRETVVYLMGMKRFLHRVYVAALIGFMDRCDLSGINYRCLLDQNLHTMELQVTIGKFISNGASLDHLKIDNTDTAFHAAVFMFMQTFHHTTDATRSGILMNLVLDHRPEMVNARDARGDTALHMIAKEPTHHIQDAKQITLFVLLHEKHADPTIEDQFHRRPSFYLSDIPLVCANMKQIEKEFEQKARASSSAAAATKGTTSKQGKPTKTKAKENTKQEEKPNGTKLNVKPQPQQQTAQAKTEMDSSANKKVPDASPCSVCESRIEAARVLSGKANWSKAVDKVMEIVRSEHKNTRHQKLLGDAYKFLRKAILIKEIFTKESLMNELVFLPEKEVKVFVTHAAEADKWHVVAKLLSSFIIKVAGGDSNLLYHRDCLAQRENKHVLKPTARLVNLADEVELSPFIFSNYEKNFHSHRSQLLEHLLRMGASADERGVKLTCPLAACVAQNDHSSMCVLLQHGADPAGLATDKQQQPLPVALQMALLGHPEPLETLFKLYEVFSIPKLAPNIQDKDGNTLFHLAASAKYTSHALTVVQMLCENGYNPNLRNANDQDARMCLKGRRQDRRIQYVRQQAAQFEKVAPVEDKAQKKFEPPEEETSEAQSEASSTPADSKKQKGNKEEQQMKSKSKEENLIVIRLAIEELPDFEVRFLDDSFTPAEPSQTASPSKTESTPQKEPEREAEPEAEKSRVAEEEDEDETDDVAQNVLADPTIFDDLDWEVECTSDVWRTLQHRKVTSDMKQRIIVTIQLLASGEWSQRLCKKLKGAPDTMQLFESKLSRDSRLIWELAIAFSPRRSETAERRLGVESGDKSGAIGGRIYSEIIRVWEIVLAHDHISRSVERISKSHKRGRDCIVYKKLKGIERRQFPDQNFVGKKLPMLFMEEEEIVPEIINPGEDFFPPASSKETEYHIMKFYSFTSALVNNLISEQGMKVDFPFKVTDLEHAIINLRPKPPCSLLLLGRSGTGKTTCCLYRLWSSFINYWENACNAGAEALIPRAITFLQDSAEDEEAAADEQQADQLTLDEIISKKIKEEQRADDDNIYDHLHQIFITKNAVLCSEVQKTFRELSHAHKSAASHVEVEELPLPNRLQEAHPCAFPLFINSRQFLMLLDGSLPGKSFFSRNEDGSVARQIKGWNDDDGPLMFIPMTNDMEDDDEDELDDEVDPVFEQQELGAGAREKTRMDLRKHVSYEVFANELWIHINRDKLDYHPSLVWMEITSFILGSVEANGSDSGFLTEEEYMTLGKKRAPNFGGDRSKIYSLFRRYQRMKLQKGLFDESDLTHNLHQRMEQRDKLDWVIHEIYVDETQDFTQAELSLLIRCSQNPNNLFFTGDTAQSIMRGIAFRFEDLKTLFYYARQSLSAVGKASAVQVPKKVYQLTHNYRSHAGILRLANSVVELMLQFFPESFDRLQPDQGLFEGPRPVLLESYSFSDLAVLLSGSRRKTSSPIEFGAHQAILVANDEAREQLPPELSTALVLTIFESKGLEFDDVLLYNFFCDSPAMKEWRVITKHLDNLVEKNEQTAAAGTAGENLRQIDISQFEASDRPRPLDFDPEKHKVLNSELKYLYTAITRARVNVWIFDESQEARAPMFEYFRALKLVQSIMPGEEMEELDDDNVSKMFTSKSTPEEWNSRGDEFYRRNLFNVAAKCYMKSGNEIKQKMSQAQQRAIDAANLKRTPKEMRDQFVAAAAEFMQCNMEVQAARCLYNAKEFTLAAQVFEKIGQFHHAAKLYQKLRQPEEASRCHEQVLHFDQAVEVLVAADMFDKAIDVVERYQLLLKEDKTKMTRERAAKLENNAPSVTHSVKRLSLRSALYYHKHGQEKAMITALNRIPNENERIEFLKKHKYIELAHPLLRKQGRGLEIAQQYREEGNIKKALDYASEKEDAQFLGECYLILARNTLQDQNPDKEQLDEAKRNLDAALELLREHTDRLEAQVMLASIAKSASKEKTMQNCKAETHLVGEIACFEILVNDNHSALTRNVSQGFIPVLEAIFKLLAAFAKPTSNAEKKYIKDCFKYYGLTESSSADVLVVKRSEGSRFLKMSSSTVMSDGTVARKDAIKVLSNSYIAKAKHWVQKVREHLKRQETKTSFCPDFLAGFSCSSNNDCAVKLHKHPFHNMYVDHTTVLVNLIALGHVIRQAITVAGKRSVELERQLKPLSDEDLGRCCRNLREHIFPKWGIPWWSLYSEHSIWELLKARRNPHVVQAMTDHINIRLDRRDALQRQACSDLHLEVLQIINIVAAERTVLGSFLSKEEAAFNKGSAEKKKSSLGFVADKGQSQYISYFRFYWLWIQGLHVKVNSQEAFKNLNHFLNHLSGHNVNPLLPTIAHAMELLEIGIVLIQAMYSYLYPDVRIVLPLSYVHLINLWDSLHKRNKDYAPLFHVIEKEPSFQHLLRYLNELVGHMMQLVDSKFDMIQDALSGEDECLRNGEAERVLVMALVCLVNSGSDHLLDEINKGRLLDALSKVDISQEEAYKYPKRVVDALQELDPVYSSKDIAPILAKFLKARSGEELRTVSWDKTRHRFFIHKDMSVMGTSVFQSIHTRAAQQQKFTRRRKRAADYNPQQVQTRIVYHGDTSAIMAQAAEERKANERKEHAAKIIQLAVKKALFRRHVKRGLREVLKSTRTVHKYNIHGSDYMDSTMCQLCNVSFTPAAVEHDSDEVVSEDEKEQHSVQPSRNVDSTSLQRQHYATTEHKQNLQEFALLQKFVNTEMSPLLVNVDEFVENTVNATASTTRKEELEELQKVSDQEQKVLEALKNIERKREWGTLRDIRYEAEQLRMKLKECLDYMAERAKDKEKMEEYLAKEKEMMGDDHDIIDAPDDLDDEELMPVSKASKRPKKMRRTKKSRK